MYKSNQRVEVLVPVSVSTFPLSMTRMAVTFGRKAKARYAIVKEPCENRFKRLLLLKHGARKVTDAFRRRLGVGMPSLDSIGRRRLLRAAILSSATLILAPELAFASSHGAACANGGQTCDQCRIIGVAARPRQPQRTVNPWLNWRAQ